MKFNLFTVILLASTLSYGKVKGFHEMIESNSKSQKELLQSVQSQITAAEEAGDDSTIVYKTADKKHLRSIHLPSSQANLETNKDFLTYDKEKYKYQLKRVENKGVGAELNEVVSEEQSLQ